MEEEGLTWRELFEWAAEVGLSPSELLDMELWQVYSYMKGYKRRMLQLSSHALYSGYWSAYYSSSKRSRSPKFMLEKMQQQLERDEKGTDLQGPDVETFMRRENARIQRMKARAKNHESESKE